MTEPFYRRIAREEFDYQTLMVALKDYSCPRDKVSDLIRKGSIIRVKKGLYVMGDEYRKRPYSKKLLANLIYGPSYISLDYALSYHGMIPERVEAVTSVTTGRSRRFSTPLGLFFYRSIPLTAFRFGMMRVETDSGTSFLIASPEKALCDKIREDRRGRLRGIKEMRRYLLEDLRIDKAALVALNPDHITDIADRYRSAKIRLLKQFIDRYKYKKDAEADGK